MAEKPDDSPAKTKTAKATTPPTLVQKEKDSRRHTLASPSSDSDDEELPLQWRAHLIPDPPDPDDNSDGDQSPEPLAPHVYPHRALQLPFNTADAAAYYWQLQVLHPPDSDDSESSELTPAELVEAICESSCMNTLDCYGPSALRRLLNNPGFTVLRTGTSTALVLFADGRHYVFLSADVNAAIESLGPAVALSHTLPYTNGIPREIIWVDSESDEDDPLSLFPHASSSAPSPAIPSRPPIDPDTEKIVRVPAHLGCDYILWADYTGCCKPGE